MSMKSSANKTLDEVSKELLAEDIYSLKDEKSGRSILGRWLLAISKSDKSKLAEILEFNSYLDLEFHPQGDFCRYLIYLQITKKINKLTPNWKMDPRRKRLINRINSIFRHRHNSSYFDGAAGFLKISYLLRDKSLQRLVLRYIKKQVLSYQIGSGIHYCKNYLPASGPMRTLNPKQAKLNRIPTGNAHGLSGLIYSLHRYCLIENRRKSKVLIEEFQSSLNQIRLREPTMIRHVWPSDDLANTLRLTSGWCTGSAGISYTMIMTTGWNKLNQQEQTKWKNLFLESSKIKNFKVNIRGLSICHGAAGIVLMSLLLHRKTKDQDYFKHAATWIKLILEIPVQSWNQESKNGYGFDDMTLGQVGVALALKSYLEPDFLNRDWHLGVFI